MSSLKTGGRMNRRRKDGRTHTHTHRQTLSHYNIDWKKWKYNNARIKHLYIKARIMKIGNEQQCQHSAIGFLQKILCNAFSLCFSLFHIKLFYLHLYQLGN